LDLFIFYFIFFSGGTKMKQEKKAEEMDFKGREFFKP